MVWVWPSARQQALRLAAHDAPVRGLQLSPDLAWLVSASDEGRVCLWTFDGSLLATMHAAGPVTALLFQPPDRIWVATANASVALYQVIPAR